MAQRRARLKIHGRVQGVYYRSTAQLMARRMGVKGWVRNCPDGTVEILAEGDAKDLEPFLAWCERGPSGARVRKVDLSWEEPRGEFPDFSVTF
jgi:acylphosphatase